MGGFVISPLPPVSVKELQNSGAPSLRGRYPASTLLRAPPPPSPRCGERIGRTGGPFPPAGFPPPRRYCGPLRHPLAFGRLPGVAGYTAYLSPPISRRGKEGFSSCSMCPCHRAVAPTPPER